MATSCGNHSYFEPLLNLATNSGFTPLIITCDETIAVLACLNPFATKTQHYVSHVSLPNLSVPHTALAPLIAPRGFKWPSVTQMMWILLHIPKAHKKKHHLSGECGCIPVPVPKKKDGEPSPFTAMGSATNLALGFLLLVFFSGTSTL